MPKLTKSVVDAATPREKQFTIWCRELKGFGAFVQPSGSRTYFVDYRNGDGVRKRMTIGRHGKITADQARKLAIATLGETVKGRDPGRGARPAAEGPYGEGALRPLSGCSRQGAYLRERRLAEKGKLRSTSIAGASIRHSCRCCSKRRVQSLKPADVNKLLKMLLAESLQRSRDEQEARQLYCEGRSGTAAANCGASWRDSDLRGGSRSHREEPRPWHS